MKTCYIIGAGGLYGCPLPRADDLVIAADGGYAEIISHGVRCDLLIGDFDSLDELPDEVEVIRFPVEKDDTDSFLAYREGVKRGYTDFEIYGGTGGVEDHTYANYCLLHYARREGHTARLVGKRNISRVIMNESITLRGEVGKRVSLFAIGGEAHGVSINGLKYTGERLTLEPPFPLGVSNYFVGAEAVISVADGALLVMTER